VVLYPNATCPPACYVDASSTKYFHYIRALLLLLLLLLLPGVYLGMLAPLGWLHAVFLLLLLLMMMLRILRISGVLLVCVILLLVVLGSGLVLRVIRPAGQVTAGGAGGGGVQ
jgi:hypothetical protein